MIELVNLIEVKNWKLNQVKLELDNQFKLINRMNRLTDILSTILINEDELALNHIEL